MSKTTDLAIDKLNAENHKIFMRRIKVYNTENKRFTHYVALDDDTLMVIDWENSWNYNIYTLERERNDYR